MITLPAEGLERLGTKIFEALGMGEDRAAFVSHTLVEANLTGHDSHGVFYFVTYADRIRNGFIDVKAEPAVAKETPNTALVDGRWAPGQVTAMRVAELAVEKAKDGMVGAVGAFNCNHIGRVGYYTSWAAGRGAICMMFRQRGKPHRLSLRWTGEGHGDQPLQPISRQPAGRPPSSSTTPPQWWPTGR